ncbi:hypothetical protein PIB30_008989 [Stylosanthes scabra]|uniref:Uncharacterized protein n=1 Tax=Stylosanthes scabra TaxID=79078 RepID=A0ABU6S5N2_9FABA|nr:hypothetical protein [Stylosanthes scabra]
MEKSSYDLRVVWMWVRWGMCGEGRGEGHVNAGLVVDGSERLVKVKGEVMLQRGSGEVGRAEGEGTTLNAWLGHEIAKQLSQRPANTFSSDTMVNPREECKVVSVMIVEETLVKEEKIEAEPKASFIAPSPPPILAEDASPLSSSKAEI